MTDEEIKNIVTRYILSQHESDNADCLNEMDEFDIPGLGDEEFEDLFERALAFYRQATLAVTYGEATS